jgi:hypothetical protein
VTNTIVACAGRGNWGRQLEPCGSANPPVSPSVQESRDIGQFIDDDGSAYLIFEDRPAKGFHIASLSDDYLTVEKEVCLINAPLEGGADVNAKALWKNPNGPTTQN